MNLKSIFKKFEEILSLPEDTKPERVRKTTLFIVSSLIGLAGFIWSAMYFLLGYKLSSVFPLSYSILVFITILIYLKFKAYGFFLFVQLLLILTLPFFLQSSLGGFSKSGAVIVWSFLAPAGALFFAKSKRAYTLIFCYICLIILSTITNDFWVKNTIPVPNEVQLVFYLMNIGAVSVIVFIAFIYFVNQLEIVNLDVKEKNDKLESLASKLSKYLSPQVYASIFSGNKDVTLDSYRKNLTIFFSDIKGFTEMTDRMESESLSSLLNNYLNEMANIALRYGGTIDKYIGDAIMIFFGDPESKGVKEDAIACVKMAIDMRERMKELRTKWELEGIVSPLHIRIGINTGYCTVGNFGSKDRLDYTIVGGNVNLASRLESKADPDQILISKETFLLVKDAILCQQKGLLKVKGIAYEVPAYEVVDLLSNVSDASLENRKIKEDFDGFSIQIDTSKADNQRVIKILKEVIEKIEIS
ncbi:MAG: adenylate/guanylate cyclase domain-containing protein [Leptospiraceae bacterium]|nr:adenylate/guanylate cyclase domain-containing protein [Leptospiraceae bacterium]